MKNKIQNHQQDESPENKGFIQVYTGNGKGKTTASLGLAMRALGWNLKVLIIMFAKGGDKYGELKSFQSLHPRFQKNLKIIQAGLDRIVYKKNLTQKDKELVQEGWNIAQKAIKENTYDVIILDEANIAIDLNIIDLKEVLEVLKNKPKNLEIVLTGRNAKPEIIEIAHLVSEIKPVKHYMDIGVKARKGIEF